MEIFVIKFILFVPIVNTLSLNSQENYIKDTFGI